MCYGNINFCFADIVDKDNEPKTEEQEFIRQDKYIRQDGYLFMNSGLESANMILKYALKIKQPDAIIKEKPKVYYSKISDKKSNSINIFTNKKELLNWAESYNDAEIISQVKKLKDEDFNEKSILVFRTNVYGNTVEDVQLDYIMTNGNMIYTKFRDNSEILDFKNKSYLEMSFIEKKPDLKYYYLNETNIITGGEKSNYIDAGFWTNGQVEEGFTVVRSKEELEKYKNSTVVSV